MHGIPCFYGNEFKPNIFSRSDTAFPKPFFLKNDNDEHSVLGETLEGLNVVGTSQF